MEKLQSRTFQRRLLVEPWGLVGLVAVETSHKRCLRTDDSCERRRRPGSNYRRLGLVVGTPAVGCRRASSFCFVSLPSFEAPVGPSFRASAALRLATPTVQTGSQTASGSRGRLQRACVWLRLRLRGCSAHDWNPATIGAFAVSVVAAWRARRREREAGATAAV